jgi:hypothetical protein
MCGRADDALIFSDTPKIAHLPFSELVKTTQHIHAKGVLGLKSDTRGR